jgi:hypothetical protein
MILLVDSCVEMPLYIHFLGLDEDFGGLSKPIIRLTDDAKTDVETNFGGKEIKKLSVLESIYCH